MRQLYAFFLIFLSLSVRGQLREFYVTQREPDGNLVVQANWDFPDNALVFVYSDLEGLEFRSSLGGINRQYYNQRASRYELLVTPQKQILFVAAYGFIEERVALINPAPKAVLLYQVEERKGQDMVAVYFRIYPPDAIMMVDEAPTAINQTVKVPSRTVRLQLIREGYYEVDEMISISADQVNYEFSMEMIANDTEEVMESSEEKTPTSTLPLAIQHLERDMVFVKGGKFMRGCTAEQLGLCLPEEKPAHRVLLNDFFMGKYEVTVAQFAVFIEATGYQTDADRFGGSSVWTGETWKKSPGINWMYSAAGKKRAEDEFDHPVVHVSWNDAVAFCKWLSDLTEKNYRLPTEAEWEYAARGGQAANATRYAGGGDLQVVAWYKSNSGMQTQQVGRKEANELGIYDLSGNVWEWCADWYGKYAAGEIHDPQGARSGTYRILRGGSWLSLPKRCRVSNRDYNKPQSRGGDSGFRVVLQ
ncbi:MAG: formylglycine-generating enzyme family protein [Flavobacteriales bacterium]|nr:MAG: formylglycine-generating enzyme family protein [Flavobacteriales bacterium]